MTGRPRRTAVSGKTNDGAPPGVEGRAVSQASVQTLASPTSGLIARTAGASATRLLIAPHQRQALAEDGETNSSQDVRMLPYQGWFLRRPEAQNGVRRKCGRLKMVTRYVRFGHQCRDPSA